MGLNQTNKFEDAEETTQTDTVQGSANVSNEVAATGEQTGTAITMIEPETKTSALAVVKKPPTIANVIKPLKDSFQISYDSLPRIAAEQGDFVEKVDGTVLGQKLVITLLSYQDSYVASTGDRKAPMETVKFSDDPHVAPDGTNLLEHVAYLKANNYPKARLEHRVVIVGELLTVDGKNDKRFCGDLVQISLPPTGRRAFETFILQVSYKAAKGRIEGDQVHTVELVTIKAKSKDDEAFTKIGFNILGSKPKEETTK